MTYPERHAVRLQLLHSLDVDGVPGRWLWRHVIRLADWLDRP